MTRAQPVFDHLRSQQVIEIATELFDELGYHGTTVREIAAGAGLSLPLLYELFPAKQSILREIVDVTYGGAVAQTEAAVADADGDPAAALEAAVWAQCDFYIRCRRACRVAERELVNLAPEDRLRAEARRVALGEVLREIIADGVHAGVFDVSEPAATSRALASMCVAIGSWYEPGGHDVPRQIAQTYCDLAQKMAGVRIRAVDWRERRRGLTAVAMPTPVALPVTA